MDTIRAKEVMPASRAGWHTPPMPSRDYNDNGFRLGRVCAV
jgi:hypothetical protein